MNKLRCPHICMREKPVYGTGKTPEEISFEICEECFRKLQDKSDKQRTLKQNLLKPK